MSLRNYDNSNSPRLVTVINDGQLIAPAVVTGERVIVLGFSNNPNLPVQELYPANQGTLDSTALIAATYNIDANDNPYPSELSVALEELFKAGSPNVQIVNLGLSDRMRDMTDRMARERYIALENAYDLLVDLSVDRIYPVNVVAGLKGDGEYNAQDTLDVSLDPTTVIGALTSQGESTVGKTWEVIYDLDVYSDPATPATQKAFSSVPGYVIVLDEAYLKSAQSTKEDLVYQLGAICNRVTSNGSYCTGIYRTISPAEFKYLVRTDFTATGAGTFYGALDTGLAYASTSGWAIAKNYNVDASGGADYAAAGADEAVTAATALAAIEAGASMADVAGGYKEVFTRTGGAASPTTVADGATALEEAFWQIFYGSVSASLMKSFLRMLNSFGGSVPAILKDGASNSVIDFAELDAKSSVDGETPDTYAMFATTDAEKPTGPDATNVITDDNGRAVDIGYLLDRVVSNSIFTCNFPASTLSPKTFNIATGIGQILAWYNSLPSSVATTRQVTSVVAELGQISSRAVSDLTRNGYQAFYDQDGEYTMSRDITTGLFISNVVRTDFINRMTTNILKDALDIANFEGRKLLGKADSARAREGLKQKLEQEYARWAHPEDGRLRKPASVEVYSSGVGAVIGRITIILRLAIANEILEIRTVASVE